MEKEYLRSEKINSESVEFNKMLVDWDYVIDYLIDSGKIKGKMSFERKQKIIEYLKNQNKFNKDIRLIIENENLTLNI